LSQIEDRQPLIDTSKLQNSDIQALLASLIKETEQNKQVQQNHSNEIEQLKNLIQMQQETLEKYKNENKALRKNMRDQKISKLKKQNRKLKKKIDLMKLQVAEEIFAHYQSKQKLVETLSKEESMLKEYKKLLKQYDAISKSKLGQLTLFYWKKRKQIKRGF
jgi:predicted RNase H-like nuclease (RuvC/YqgF family)